MSKHITTITIDLYFKKQVLQIAQWLQEKRIVNAVGDSSVKAYATNGASYGMIREDSSRNVRYYVDRKDEHGHMCRSTFDQAEDAAWALVQQSGGDASIVANMIMCSLKDHPIPWGDISYFRYESNQADSVPDCCNECAEIAAVEDRKTYTDRTRIEQFVRERWERGKFKVGYMMSIGPYEMPRQLITLYEDRRSDPVDIDGQNNFHVIISKRVEIDFNLRGIPTITRTK
jgi:hypothetical protein